MILLETIAVAFAMFSAIPVPQPVWNQKNMRYAMCAFPLVGVVCALLYLVWAVICRMWPQKVSPFILCIGSRIACF